MAKTTTKKAAPKRRGRPAKKKAEVKQEVQEVAVDYSKFDYRPSDSLQVKAEYVGKIRQALQIAVQNGAKEHFPTITGWIAVNSGVPVENPTKEAIAAKQVRPMMNLEATFAEGNLKVTYEPWVSAMAEALELINIVHQENVDLGNATTREDLQKEAVEAQKKAEEEAKAQAEAKTDPDA